MLRRCLKKLWSVFRTGLSVLVPIFIVVGFVIWLWTILTTMSGGRIWAALAILFGGPFLVGPLVSQKWFRSAVLRFCGDIPVVSTIANFLLNHDYVEQMKNGNLMREVMWEVSEGVWVFGVVVSRQRMPLNPHRPSSPVVDWVAVIAPTTPFFLTGVPVLIPECRVIYNGRKASDTALTVASFGFNMKLDYNNFTSVELDVPKEFHYQAPNKKGA